MSGRLVMLASVTLRVRMCGLELFLIATEWVYLLVGEAFLCVEIEWPLWPSVCLSPCLMYVLVGKRRVQDTVCSCIGKEARSQQNDWHVKVQRLGSKPYA